MFEIVFVDSDTGVVNYAITNVSRVRYITSSEVGFDADGRSRSSSFRQTENIEVRRIPRSEV